jgi:hypothetical protein
VTLLCCLLACLECCYFLTSGPVSIQRAVTSQYGDSKGESLSAGLPMGMKLCTIE